MTKKTREIAPTLTPAEVGTSTSQHQELRSRLAHVDTAWLGTSVLATAGTHRVRHIPGLQPAWPGASMVGLAFTVKGVGGDNLAIHHAIKDAVAGDVLVVDVDGRTDVAHFGDILALAARTRNVAGLVINGAIRDRQAIAELGFPVFHLGTSPLGPTKLSRGQSGMILQLTTVTIAPGDLIAGDADGVLAVSITDASAVLDAAHAVFEREKHIADEIKEGKSTIELFGL